VVRRSGYATGLVGKWHLGAYDPRYHPNQRGFDEAVCFRGGMHDYYNWRLEYDRTVRRSDGRYLTDVFTQEAVRFIERHAAEPFFLHLTYNAPHTPLQAPDDEVAPFADTGRFTSAVSVLYGMIHRVDSGVARILETLRRLGLEEDTLLLFTSDNGPQFGGEGESCTTRFNCEFNGAKGVVYEGGIRVPMILRWPAGIDGGREVHQMVHFCDWFPTLLSAAGVAVPQDLAIDGVNILPILQGEEAEGCTRRFWQWNRYTPLVTSNAAMRDGQWKLVRPAIREAMQVPDLQWLRVSMYEPEHFIEKGVMGGPYPDRDVPPPPPPELYNIAQDPLERQNLADQEPERVGRMMCDLETWFEEVEAERATIAPGRS
jgi:arylsulfatase A